MGIFEWVEKQTVRELNYQRDGIYVQLYTGDTQSILRQIIKDIYGQRWHLWQTHVYHIYIVLPPLTKFYYMHMTCNLHVYQTTDTAYKIPFYI